MAGVTGALLLGLPTIAGAVVYCVPDATIDASCTVGQGQTTIQAALTAAQGSTGVADTVRIDAGAYSEANLTYSDTNAANVVTILGAGADQTLLTMPDTMGNKVGLLVTAPAGSTIQALGMTIPANADGAGDRGIQVFGATDIANVTVDGPASSNATGIQFQSSGTLSDSTVNLPFANPSNGAVSTVSGDQGKIFDSTLIADTGLTHGGNGTTTIERTMIRAKNNGVNLDQGTVLLRDSLVDMGGNSSATAVNAANFNNSVNPIAATIDGSTIVNGGASSTGVRAQADSAASVPMDATNMVDDGETSTVTVSNTVIDGYTVPIRVEADRGETATLTASYSNYDPDTTVVTPDLAPSGGTGTATFTETSNTDFAPGFVNPGTDYHLMSGSPLIDIGDPANPDPARQDIDGDARELDGLFDCATDPRRDIGADEFIGPALADCIQPDTSITSGPNGPTNDNTPTFAFTSNETPVTFQCGLDGAAFSACSTPFTTPALQDGAHTLAVRAIDASLNADSSPAARSFTVDTVAPNTTLIPFKKKKKKKKKLNPGKLLASYIVGSTEPGSTLRCTIDGAVIAPCGPMLVRTLRAGRHSITAVATDAAGNTDASPATASVRVKKRKRK